MTFNLYHITHSQLRNYITLILFLLLISFNPGCKEKQSSDEEAQVESTVKTGEYEDGIYCADVAYYNPNTQRKSDYTLNVEVMNGKLIKIMWSNGGWLDDSHFTPPVISSSGDCSFTSDKGYQYDISIKGAECSFTDNPKDIEGSGAYMTRKQCAEIYGASNELFEAYLKRMNTNADELVDREGCTKMHEALEVLDRLISLENRMNNGYIQSTYSRGQGDDMYCRTMVVKRNGMFYLFVITRGKPTMGLTDFNPDSDQWQELIIHPDPNSLNAVVVSGKILEKSSDKDYLKQLSESYCE